MLHTGLVDSAVAERQRTLLSQPIGFAIFGFVAKLPAPVLLGCPISPAVLLAFAARSLDPPR